MPSGDHVLVVRWFGAYLHHGIYAGRRRVIHYSGSPAEKSDAAITETTLSVFSDGDAVYRVVHPSPLPPRTVMKRARGRLGERGYDLFSNNCEHFARWCKLGEHSSEQLDGPPLVGSGLLSEVRPGHLAQLANAAQRLPPIAGAGVVAGAAPLLLPLIGAAGLAALVARHYWLMRHTEPFSP